MKGWLEEDARCCAMRVSMKGMQWGDLSSMMGGLVVGRALAEVAEDMLMVSDRKRCEVDYVHCAMH